MRRHRNDEPYVGGHQEVWELLPWYVNGTLDDLERRTVTAHLATCSPCQAELARCHALATAVRAPEAVGWSPSPDRFSRLVARLDAAPARDVAQSGRWERLRAAVTRGWLVLQGAPRPLRWALIAEGAVALALAGVVVWQASLPSESLYRTLTGTSRVAADLTDRIRVVFAEDVTEREIRLLLTRVKGTIVDGPSPLGVYTVAVPRPGSGPEPGGAALEALRADPHVRLVEPLHTR